MKSRLPGDTPLLSPRDVNFLLYEWLEVESLCKRQRFAGHVVLAWIWLEQALAAEGKAGDFYDGKRAAARYFFSYELPKTAAQFDLLAGLDRSMLELSESWF